MEARWRSPGRTMGCRCARYGCPWRRLGNGPSCRPSPRWGERRRSWMGLEIDRDHFDEEHFQRFSERLQQNLAALAEVLARPGFGAGPASIGAELELSLVDGAGRPLPYNRA